MNSAQATREWQSLAITNLMLNLGRLNRVWR
jgi:hypothetical protein